MRAIESNARHLLAVQMFLAPVIEGLQPPSEPRLPRRVARRRFSEFPYPLGEGRHGSHPLPSHTPATYDSRLRFALALKSLVNHEQPNSDVTGGYLKLTPDRLREPAQQIEDRLLKLARATRGQRQATPERAADRGRQGIQPRRQQRRTLRAATSESKSIQRRGGAP